LQKSVVVVRSGFQLTVATFSQKYTRSIRRFRRLLRYSRLVIVMRVEYGQFWRVKLLRRCVLAKQVMTFSSVYT